MHKTAWKLHRQFGHPSADRLVKLLRAAGSKNKHLEAEIQALSESCDTCKKFKKAPPRPVVSMPMSYRFNEMIAMDLKCWDKCYFLVIIDLATRFCAATVINNKQPATVIDGIFLCWISVFGAPSKVLTDNGREYNCEEFRQMGEAFNIKLLTTAAEAPWSNGSCERLNQVLGNHVTKILDASQCSLKTALAWAVAARNALVNNFGFSPNQLVFGHNPALPNLFQDKPPALGPVSSSEVVRKNLNALHSARQEFIRLESDERIRRALRHNIRETNLELIENGREVYYKRNNDKEWHGPGVVIGRDGKQVFVRHGGTIYRVHLCRISGSSVPEDKVKECEVTEEVKDKEGSSVVPVIYEDSGEWGYEDVNTNAEVCQTIAGRANGTMGDVSTDAEVFQTSGRAGETVEGISRAVDDPLNGGHVETVGVSAIAKPRNWRKGDRFTGIDEISGEFVSGKVLSRAGKVTGINRDCYNIERDNDGSCGWCDFGTLKDLTFVPEDTEMLVMYCKDEVWAAKKREIENWQANEVYVEVDDVGQLSTSSRWVITEKLRSGVTEVKARLVARGFEEHSLDIRKDSPTCSKEAVRILLSIAGSYRWMIHSEDVKAAYLQGKHIEREVYLRPPEDIYNGRLWRLKKTVYGLKDAARAWYLRLKEALLEIGADMCNLEGTLFMWYYNNVLEGIVCVYVDDFLWTGTNRFEQVVIDKIRNEFKIGSAESNAFKYIGLNIESNQDGFTVDQIQYCMSLHPIKISNTRSTQKSSSLSEREKEEYRSLVGQLSWIANHTRPDISFEVNQLSVLFKHATVTELLRINKLVSMLLRDHCKVMFPMLDKIERCTIECFSDAAFSNLPDGSSQGAFILFLRDFSGKRCPIYWQSRKLRRVVKSTLAAETMAMLEAAETATYIAKILADITRQPQPLINCYVDNQSLVDSLNSSKCVDDKRLRIDLAVMKDMLSRGEVNQVKWVSSQSQLADSLTKRGASTERLRTVLYMP